MIIEAYLIKMDKKIGDFSKNYSLVIFKWMFLFI